MSAFTYIEVNNSGTIYGGAGGGGAGVLPITSENAQHLWPDGLSASSGGGGGAGITPNGTTDSGVGVGGTKYNNNVGSFVNIGGTGTQTSGGSGGGISLPSPFTSTQFKVMSGGPGGNLGESGIGNDIPDDYTNYDNTFKTDAISSFAFRGVGGNRGQAVIGPVAWTTRTSDVNTGTGTWCANT